MSGPNETDFRAIVGEVLETLFGADGERLPELATGPEVPKWTGFIGIGGLWTGAVTLTAVRSMVVAVASAMLEVPASAVDEPAALTNVVAGNVKALISESLKSTCTLSLPAVFNGALTMPAAALILEYPVSWRHHSITTRVFRAVPTELLPAVGSAPQ